ncbi:helix-turn-helix transcriptional regulator [Gemmatimonadota bacterium]
MEQATAIRKRFLNLREVAEFCGVSRSSVLRWEQDGLFPARRRLGPARVGWDLEELEEWAAARQPVRAAE